MYSMFQEQRERERKGRKVNGALWFFGYDQPLKCHPSGQYETEWNEKRKRRQRIRYQQEVEDHHRSKGEEKYNLINASECYHNQLYKDCFCFRFLIFLDSQFQPCFLLQFDLTLSDWLNWWSSLTPIWMNQLNQLKRRRSTLNRCDATSEMRG